MIKKIDHIALAVSDFEGFITFFCENLGFRLGRRGTHNQTGKAIAFLWEPGSGVKIELIESEEKTARVDHWAFISDNIPGDSEALSAKGLPPQRGPLRNEKAKMQTAHFVGPEGLKFQLCDYDSDAEDIHMP